MTQLILLMDHLGMLVDSPHPFFSSKGFNLESSLTSNIEKLEILKVSLLLYSHVISSLYALSLIHLRTWNEPSLLGCNLDLYEL
jgi:hypothetical protein